MENSISELRFDGEHDKLKRKKYAVQLTNFLLEQGKDYNVICINSSWGTGKTWFIRMWIDMLQQEKKDSVIPVYYNAWENDDFANAFEPLIGELNNELFEKQSGDTVDKIKKAAGAILKSGLINAVLNLSGGTLNIQAGLDAIRDNESLFGAYTKNYNEANENKRIFREQLEEYAKERSAFIFVDELDRCRPIFAIETLERIKHYFDIANVFFILVLDKTQLSHSVRLLYGEDCDTAGYLTRFIDVEYHLPSIEGSQYFKLKMEERNRLDDSICDLIKFFTLSLREVDKLIIWIKVLVVNVPELHKACDEVLYLLAYLLLLKLKYNNFFYKLFNKYEKRKITYSDIPFSDQIDTFIVQKTDVKIINLFCVINKISGKSISTKREHEIYESKKWMKLLLDVNKILSGLEQYDI